MFKHLFLVYTLHWLTQLTLMAAVCWQWLSKLLSSVISLFWGNKTTKTKPFDRDLLLLPPFLSLTCIYSLMMSVKCSHECLKKKVSEWWWWSYSVKSDLYIQRELGLAVMMLLPEGLHSSTLTTRGRVIKQSHKEHSEEDVSIILNELNYYFWRTVNWTLIVLLLHLFAFVLFVWNHSFFFCGFGIKKRIHAFWKTIEWLFVFSLSRICVFVLFFSFSFRETLILCVYSELLFLCDVWVNKYWVRNYTIQTRHGHDHAW